MQPGQTRRERRRSCGSFVLLRFCPGTTPKAVRRCTQQVPCRKNRGKSPHSEKTDPHAERGAGVRNSDFRLSLRATSSRRPGPRSSRPSSRSSPPSCDPSSRRSSPLSWLRPWGPRRRPAWRPPRRGRRKTRGRRRPAQRRSSGSFELQGCGRAVEGAPVGRTSEQAPCLLLETRQVPEIAQKRLAGHAATRRGGFPQWSRTPHLRACRSSSLALRTPPLSSPRGEPVSKHQDADPVETREWIDAIESVIDNVGAERARFLLENLIGRVRKAGVDLPFSANTPYVNTIPVSAQPQRPSDFKLEGRLSSITRWNAMALVVRANKEATELGGHVASYASAATLYDIGFNHFWHAPSEKHGGDLVYMQGHSSPGFYARAYLEGRLTDEQMRNFRQEVDGNGLSSYPHPWLMPDFWQFPTVSMGLGPLMAIYQARFMKYLQGRNVAETAGRKVWCFLGDGETDEPESLGAISVAGRERLDNLVFVVNCNLQRLDGPVRGNGKIIQELEGNFRGAGWNVIKTIWGTYWDPLLARDPGGKLRQLMMETVDGEYQNCKAFGGKYTREHFFGKYPETAALVANLSDDDIWRLNRGGHDPHKVYAAYDAAVKTTGQPTVILAKTVKGYGMGAAGEAQNPTHQQKKLDNDAVRHFRDRFRIPIPDDKVDDVPYYH